MEKFHKITRERASWIKWLWIKHEMKQQDIALLVGIHPGTVSHILKGRRMPEVRPERPPDWVISEALAA